MTNHRESRVVRRAARMLALAPALLVTGITSAAVAAPPEQWEDSSVPVLPALLVYLLIPLGLFLLITLLVYLPSMSRGERYQPGQAWRNEPEWFGGPRAGIEALDRTRQPAAAGGGSTAVDTGHETGGASARW